MEGERVTTKRYALGVVVSATCLVTGVLWWDRVNQAVRAEDVAACLAAGVERKWVTDWAEPPTNTVTAWARASDLARAAGLLQDALTDADVIYLDAGTWGDETNGMDMRVVYTWDGPIYQTNTHRYTHLDLTAPHSALVMGLALADRVVTNGGRFGVTTNSGASGTNFPLYAFAQVTTNFMEDWPYSPLTVEVEPAYSSFTNLTGGFNSWWERAGFGGVPYWLADVERIVSTNAGAFDHWGMSTNDVRGRYTIETRNLAQLRGLATNMLRTIQFNPTTPGTGYVYTANDGLVMAHPVGTIGPGNSSFVDGYFLSVGILENENGLDYIPFPAFAGGHAVNYIVGVPLNEGALELGLYRRVRLYAVFQASTPYCIEHTRLSNGTFYQTRTDANHANLYGWDVELCPAVSEPWPNPLSPSEVYPSFLSTNLVWTLVGDVSNPTSMPSFYIGCAYTNPFTVDNLRRPEWGYDYSDGTNVLQEWFWYEERRITHTALVIDWDFKVFGDEEYTPIETNRPAWMP
jgi:hypothetical protein